MGRLPYCAEDRGTTGILEERVETSWLWVVPGMWRITKFAGRIWDKAFTAAALKYFQSRMMRLIDRPIDHCKGEDGSIIDISGNIDHLSFDIMGALTFGEDFGMIKGTDKGSLEVRSFYDQRFEARYQRGAEVRGDIFQYLLQPDPKTGTQLKKPQIAEEAVAVVVAGSDISSICMIFIFYYLLMNQETYKTLQVEVDTLWDGTSELDGQQLVLIGAPYLNGVINESLRLAELDPNGNQRSTLKGGPMINGKYIPGSTQLSIHKWTIQRDERNVTRALEFIPERWIHEEREKIGLNNHNTKGYLPFGAGIYSCVGKPLALLEIRLFIVRFMRKLELEPALDYDLGRYPFEVASGLTLMKKPLPVMVKNRAV
ncbi:uncharacterized protein PV06_11034 [Exophiala oligosperma]|uniref:Cytochrome P450 n=1 Tax=Exophiala oligosperma TaxID=215243 RepID=A0A0D2D0C7_9EURO|nr:uncharacterized protein PV06_11034 [Exophiala oligosperma]KIW36738.1 hypothetical protein PV06_11034 [Exophiala oligosperma]